MQKKPEQGKMGGKRMQTVKTTNTRMIDTPRN